jgi:hypothetical protein
MLFSGHDNFGKKKARHYSNEYDLILQGMRMVPELGFFLTLKSARLVAHRITRFFCIKFVLIHVIRGQNAYEIKKISCIL